MVRKITVPCEVNGEKLDYMFYCEKHKIEHYTIHCPICINDVKFSRGRRNFCFDSDCTERRG